MATQPRRKPNPEERRRLLCDTAIQLLADEGTKGLSHPKVDRLAEVPNGTTSFYFRTRAALLLAAAERLAELDLIDLLSVSDPTALADVVILSASEPRLSRTRARFELLLQANRDPQLAKVFRHNGEVFTDLHRQLIVANTEPGHEPAPHVLEEQTLATMSFVAGVQMRMAAGDRSIGSAEQLDRLLRSIADGVGAAHRPQRRRPAGSAPPR